MLINILWHPLGANKDGGPIWQSGSILYVTRGTCRWLSLAAASADPVTQTDY